MKKTIRISSSRRALSLNNSAIRNTATYLSRSTRIADDKNAIMDRHLPDHTRPWADQVDRLQYFMRYSNSGQYCPEDLLSLSRGREVTAENLEEGAFTMKARASVLSHRADLLQEQSVRYWCARYYEDACTLREEAEWLEEEADRDFNRAAECRRAAEYFWYEAERILREEDYISKWEELYDMI